MLKENKLQKQSCNSNIFQPSNLLTFAVITSETNICYELSVIDGLNLPMKIQASNECTHFLVYLFTLFWQVSFFRENIKYGIMFEKSQSFDTGPVIYSFLAFDNGHIRFYSKQNKICTIKCVLFTYVQQSTDV